MKSVAPNAMNAFPEVAVEDIISLPPLALASFHKTPVTADRVDPAKLDVRAGTPVRNVTGNITGQDINTPVV
jgi:hypothetical protein